MTPVSAPVSLSFCCAAGSGFPGDRAVRLRARGHRSWGPSLCPRARPGYSFSNLFAMLLSLQPRLCTLPFPGGLSPCTSLRNCQAKVTWQDRGWLVAQTHLHKATPLRSSVPGACSGAGGSSRHQSQMKGGKARGRGMGAGSVLAGLGGCLDPGSWGAMWAGREGPPPPGSGWLRWEQIVFTPSPHT